MADIKTRDAVKGTIKTIDKAAIASERMKSAYVGIKEKAEQGYYSDENSVTEYAADRKIEVESISALLRHNYLHIYVYVTF